MKNFGYLIPQSARVACIFLDNLRVGGFQRLALDQAYELADRGYSVKLFVMSDYHSWVMPNLEPEILKGKNIQLYAVSNSRLKQILFLRENFGALLPDSFLVSHSLRFTFSLKILKLLSFQKFVINTTIHQLPRLTHTSQRIKRFIYAQFSDNLFGFSSAVCDDWSTQFGKLGRFFIRHFTRRMTLMRNGVYLDRLPSTRDSLEIKKPRIIYLGRLTFWKGLKTLSGLAEEIELNNFDFMVIVPRFVEEELAELSLLLGDRLTVITGKTVSDLEFRDGDVHVYPANYGFRVPIVESISLNCLEMASLGIPSIVTAGGMSTWPELHDSDLIHEVDWSDISKVVTKILEASHVRISQNEIDAARRLFDISNQFYISHN